MNVKSKVLQGAKGISKPIIKKPQLSQRDTYAKAMNSAMRKGGSNGVGVGY